MMRLRWLGLAGLLLGGRAQAREPAETMSAAVQDSLIELEIYVGERADRGSRAARRCRERKLTGAQALAALVPMIEVAMVSTDTDRAEHEWRKLSAVQLKVESLASEALECGQRKARQAAPACPTQLCDGAETAARDMASPNLPRDWEVDHPPPEMSPFR